MQYQTEIGGIDYFRTTTGEYQIIDIIIDEYVTTSQDTPELYDRIDTQYQQLLAQ